MNTVKIQKALAQAGVASRRQIESYIEAGRVRINNQCATIGQRVSRDDHIEFDKKTIDCFATQPTTILLYNKPVGLVCSSNDEQGRDTVFNHLPDAPDNQRWVMVGRLDLNSQGLLLFTSDGNIAHTLMHPKFKLKRIYNIRIGDELSKKQIENLKKGVTLEDGEAYFDDIRHLRTLHSNSWYQVTISSGKNRIIRRLIASQGSSVSKLVRIKYGMYSLPRTLKTGAFKKVPNLIK